MTWAVIGRHGGGAWAALDQSEIVQQNPSKSTTRVFVAAARQTPAVDRQLGHSFATPKVLCDCLKVGLDCVLTYFQAVALHCGRLERMA